MIVETFLTAVNGGIFLKVHAQPGAKNTQIVGPHGGALKIRIHAPPIDGRANIELIHFLAQLFDTSKTNVSLVKGESSRAKTFFIQGLTIEHARQAITS